MAMSKRDYAELLRDASQSMMDVVKAIDKLYYDVEPLDDYKGFEDELNNTAKSAIVDAINVKHMFKRLITLEELALKVDAVADHLHLSAGENEYDGELDTGLPRKAE